MKVILKHPHTIIMFIGISGSGKSTKAKELHESVRAKGLSSVIISSDECRKELLLDKENIFHHHDVQMYQVSDKAFDLLKKKLELHLKYPFNTEVIILDMMNLATEDREKLISLANENCYDIIAVVLDYTNIEDYFVGLDEMYDRKMIRVQLKRFRTRTMPELGKKRYDDVVLVKQKSEPLELSSEFDNDMLCKVVPKYSFVVSDVHECIKTFKELLRKAEFNIEIIDGIEKIIGRDDTQIILDGDFLDKGGYTKETLEFLYNNKDRIIFVNGNHENFVDNWLNKEGKKPDDEKMKYYSSIPVLMSDEELRNKFFEIRKLTVPFVQDKYFIATHAGCKKKYLGKLQNHAQKQQRYYYVDRIEDDDAWLEDRRKNLSYLCEEAESCEPYHIFGHEAFSRSLMYRNKVHIDTGCCYGGKLTGIEINKDGYYKIISVPCQDVVPSTHEKIREFSFEEPKVELSERDWNRIRWAATNKVNFVSGTMCPADKTFTELEDLDEALNYYRRKGIDKVMLQIKYMGSRCNVYLFDDYTKSYAVSRNGNLIRKVDLTDIFRKLRERPAIDNYFRENNVELMVIDGELMPWSALGEELIWRVFRTIGVGVQSELELLENNGFREHLAKLTEEYKSSEFDTDRHNMKKEDLYAKYGAQKYEAYKLLRNFYMPPVEELKKYHEMYSRQIDIYGESFDDKKLNYQPFSVLKSVRKNGEEILYFDCDNKTLFEMVNDAPYCICDLTDIEHNYKIAKQFFNVITKTLSLEGVVIKPLKVDNGYCAPYVKVRSPSYLTIIYGYDYLNSIKYKQLMEQKRIKLKLETSINEWILGKKLLQIPYRDISLDNKKYKDLMIKMMVEIEKEEDLDPRL